MHEPRVVDEEAHAPRVLAKKENRGLHTAHVSPLGKTTSPKS
jgi:hypothetical protein